MRWLVAVACIGCALIAREAPAADFQSEAQAHWHHWRGPNADGVAPQGNPPTTWGPETNIKWKTEIPGRGHSSPVVWGDRIFLLTAVDTGQPADGEVQQTSAEEPVAEQPSQEAGSENSERGERRFGGRGDGEGREGRGEGRRGRGGFGGGGFGRGGGGGSKNVHQFTVFCLDRATGEILWQKVAREAAPHEGGHDTNTHASASATTDGERVYCSFGSHGVYAFDLSGEKLWKRDLGDMQTRNEFGEGSTPTIYGDTLLVPWDQEVDSALAALDAATGEEKWKVPRDEVTTWNTPLVVEAAGKTQVIVNGTNRTRSYDINTGEEIWQCGGQVTNPIPSCVTFEGLVYAMTGHKGSAVIAIPLDAQGDITGSEKVAWEASRQGGPYVPSPLLYGDRLYFHKSNDGILNSVNARDGEAVIDQKRIPGIGNVYASPVGAAGRVYLTGRDGTTVVIKHGDELEVLSTNSVGEPVDASPAIVGDELFIRGEKHLFCMSEKQ